MYKLLYNTIKDSKYKLIINLYTSIKLKYYYHKFISIFANVNISFNDFDLLE